MDFLKNGTVDLLISENLSKSSGIESIFYMQDQCFPMVHPEDPLSNFSSLKLVDLPEHEYLNSSLQGTHLKAVNKILKASPYLRVRTNEYSISKYLVDRIHVFQRLQSWLKK
ncbi:hypothetical protein [Ileibacterium valens]|nr:hypothetical protein [Ileibacterium valens]